jgi:hypothetical protein
MFVTVPENNKLMTLNIYMCVITIYLNLHKYLYMNIRLYGYWLWRHIVINPAKCTDKELYCRRVLRWASLFRHQ